MSSSPRAWFSSKWMWVLLPLFILSCADDEVVVPEYLIPQQEFTALYAEVQLLEASIKQKLLRGHDSEEEIASYYEQVYSAAGFSGQQFNETKAWYAQHPEKLLEVVEQAMEYIAKKQAESGDSEEAE